MQPTFPFPPTIGLITDIKNNTDGRPMVACFFNTYNQTITLYVILSEGRRVRPPTEVEVLLRE